MRFIIKMYWTWPHERSLGINVTIDQAVDSIIQKNVLFLVLIYYIQRDWRMADGEDIQPLVCDNGTGMVKVKVL